MEASFYGRFRTRDSCVKSAPKCSQPFASSLKEILTEKACGFLGLYVDEQRDKISAFIAAALEIPLYKRGCWEPGDR